MKLALHHPFEAVEELLLLDGQEADTFAEAYAHCRLHQIGLHHRGKHQENDFYDPVEKRIPLADWEVLAGRSRRNNLTVIEDADALGNRSADRYDWSAHVGTRTTLTRDAWDQTKLSPVDRPLPPLRDRDTLNPEQRVFYDTLVDHYGEELNGVDPASTLGQL
ncbi:hypothetical protein Egran_06666 [Elaphomyces granulatus]|uniref:Uncharacterized protein n=1 Tax=Elaphomyces granulatus TaxID=519963 RepID=A0A232LN46_9EURO|nr:hypothetical protein Egran_06666 [Elaphomyces granulatus]